MATLNLGKSPQENRNGWITFIVCLLFIVIAVKCNGQLCVDRVLRVVNDKPKIRKQTCWSLEFGIFNPKGEEDTIFLGLVADSLKDSKYDIRIFVFYPKGTPLDSSYLDIGFENNGIETLKPEFIFEPRNYIEYTVTKEQAFKIVQYKSEYINFHVERNDIPFVDNYSDYLKGFFDKL